MRSASRSETVARPLAALLFGLLAAAIAGCASPVAPARETGKLFFWEISSADGAVFHLMGSVHVASRELPIDPAVEAALASSDALVMEVDPAEMDPEAIAAMVVEKGRLPPGQRLRDLISPETHAALQEALLERNMEPTSMEIFAPWVSMYMLLGAMLGEEGLDAGRGVEAQLAARAGPDLPVIGLETAEFQIDLFADLPLDTQELLLVDLLENPPDPEKELGLLIDAWEKGDDTRLEAIGLGQEEDPTADPFYEAIYLRRNYSMAAGIAELLTRSDARRYFIIVGALHTIGEEGIPTLLGERGFSVRRFDKSVAR